MTYLYLSKIEGTYFIMNSSEVYNFNEPPSNYGLWCKLDSTYDELALKAGGGLYGRIADQALDIDTLIRGCRTFKQEEANVKLNELLAQYLTSLDQIELNTLNIQVKEAEHYLSSKGSYDSAILKNLAAAQSINVDELVSNILDKAQEHNLKLISFKCLKDHIEAKLETIDSLEGFESFNIEDEITKYQSLPQAIETDDQKPEVRSKGNELTEIIETIPLEPQGKIDGKFSKEDSADNLAKLKSLEPLEKVAVSTRRRNAQ